MYIRTQASNVYEDISIVICKIFILEALPQANRMYYVVVKLSALLSVLWRCDVCVRKSVLINNFGSN
jgi:hypothetical protein